MDIIFRMINRIVCLFFFAGTILFMNGQKTALVTDFGAKPNDNRDDTSAFQSAINYLSHRGGTLNIPKGTYHISHLKFFGKKYSNISIEGNGAVIKQLLPSKRKSVHNGLWKTFAERTFADGVFVFEAQVSDQKDESNSIKNIRINNLNFVSDVKSTGFDELSHQISAHGVSGFIVEKCSFTGFLGDGIAINAGTDIHVFANAYNKNITIRDCIFDGVNKDNRQGISIYYSDGFLIENCTFRNITREDMPGAVDVEPNLDQQVSKNGIIRNCSFDNIGGIAAIVLFQRQPSIGNPKSGSNGYVVENSNFNNVNSPFAVIGNDSFKNYRDSHYNIVLRSCVINNTKSIADIRKGYGILLENIKYNNVTTTTTNVVSDGGVSLLTFNRCEFNNVKNINGLGFTGITKNINFLECRFEDFAGHGITINDPQGIGEIRDNTFLSTNYHESFPVVTSFLANKNSLKNSLITGNKSSGNFKNLTSLYYFVLGEKNNRTLIDLRPEEILEGTYNESVNVKNLDEQSGLLQTKNINNLPQ